MNPQIYHSKPQMTELFPCSRCRARKPFECYGKNTTGARLKTCDTCREKKYPCLECVEKFSYRKDLDRHIKCVHEKIKGEQCPHCEFQSARVWIIQQHIKVVHHKIKDLGCPHCDFTCGDTGNLRKHVKALHERIKDFECTKCNSMWSNSGNLRVHMKVCTGHERMSSGEYAIKGVLDAMHIEYTREMHFADCKSVNPLPFDFYLPQQLAVIEFDGAQHFKPIEFFGGQEAFEKTQMHDAIKTKYCADNGIRLLRIPYTEFERVDDLITAFLA